MPRTYKRKRNGPDYTTEDLAKAVYDVVNRNRTYRQAEEFYGVPISVIYHRIKGRNISVDKLGAGRPSVLPTDVEKSIAHCLIARSQIGYPCDKEELKNLVAGYIIANNLPNPFKNGKPGEDWYQGFMKRNPTLSLKKPEHLQTARKNARDPYIIYDFYHKLSTIFEKQDLNDKCWLVFNADESGFANDPSRLRAIGEKGKALMRVSGGSGRESTTVLACVSADGKCLPPLIVFKGGAVQSRWTSEKAYPGTLYAASTNGWMEEPQFYQWFSQAFVTHVNNVREEKLQPDQAALLLFDGHCSHISLRIIEEALKHNIQLVRFPSHLTDQLQPLDKCVFGPVKTQWERILVEFGKSQMGSRGSRLAKNEFAELLGKVWYEAMTEKNIVAGFVTTGICPVNPKKFPADLFDPRDLAHFKRKQMEIPRHKTPSTLPPMQPSPDLLEEQANSVECSPLSTSYASKSKYIGPSNSWDNIPSTSKDFDTVLDLSTKMRTNSPQKPATVRTIVELFSNAIQSSNKISKPTSTEKKVVPRLKQTRYGEVLTCDDVLIRLKEAEEKKKNKPNKLTPKKTTRKGKLKRDNNEDELEEAVEKTLEEALETNFDSDEDEFENLAAQIEPDAIEGVMYESPNEESLLPGKYISVDFVGGARTKTHYSYVCVINSNLELGSLMVTGLKSIGPNPTKNTFTLVENDVCQITLHQIKAVLPDPEIQTQNRKQVHVFPGAVAVVETM